MACIRPGMACITDQGWLVLDQGWLVLDQGWLVLLTRDGFGVPMVCFGQHITEQFVQ